MYIRILSILSKSTHALVFVVLLHQNKQYAKLFGKALIRGIKNKITQ